MLKCFIATFDLLIKKYYRYSHSPIKIFKKIKIITFQFYTTTNVLKLKGLSIWRKK